MTAWLGPVDDPRRYAIDGEVEPVATGGEGFVFRGRRVADGMAVAIKQLVTVTAADWAHQAARIRQVGEVSHPSLGRHLDSFVGPHPFAGRPPDAEEFEIFYTVMAWVDGVDLTEAVDDADLAQAMGWVRDVAHAAAALHRHRTPTGLGIVHRDIKPSNVRVTEGGAVLIDFGIARPLDGTTMTRTAGAPGWMPPEAFSGSDQIGARADVWQVGGLAAWVVLGCAPGMVPSEGRRPRLSRALHERGAPSARRLARHIERTLSTSPADRPSDPQRWGDRLVELAGRRASPQRRTVRVLVAIGLVMLAAGGAVAHTLGPGAPGPASTLPADAATGPVGRITVEPGTPVPADFGDTVPIVVEHADAQSSGQLTVRALSAGAEAPGAAPVTVDVTPPRQRVVLTVADARAGAPTVVDQLLVQRVAGPGTAAVEQRVPVRLTFARPMAAPERCTTYDPATVAVMPGPGTGTPVWRVAAGANVVAEMGPRVDAEQVAHVARQADRMCTVGTSTVRDRPLQYWRLGARLIGPPPPAPILTNADCVDYDPADVWTDDRSVFVRQGSGFVPLVMFEAPADIEQAAILARHYHGQCVIGRYGDGGRPDGVRSTVTFWR